jgi:hypothetical protein
MALAFGSVVDLRRDLERLRETATSEEGGLARGLPGLPPGRLVVLAGVFLAFVT